MEDQVQQKLEDAPILSNLGDQSEVIIVYVTVPSQEKAEELGSLLVEKKLIACANIIPGLTSIYSWKNEICVNHLEYQTIQQKDKEFLIMMKTRKNVFQELVNTVKANHPYECPEVISVNIQDAYQPYYNWVLEETKKN
ncbi:divalent ion tolerance protein [Stylonychia lemnae]|uniref:Divalent ion tolerance protein n=1 Tax=Stylonychia lemnae TaxID=5949 RepID=A0A078AB80_STYLE|nr:divalent ion tolerance protein [Stylonychia lemnae]|eukprot:CDW79550.1 divalent ion tolerance protein [Stylonychia lemnae]